MDNQYLPLLQRQCDALGLQLSDQQYNALLQYHALLVKWNKTFNLTAVRSPEEMITRHLVDSLSVLPHITAERLIDVGSGPGLPGIPWRSAGRTCRLPCWTAISKKPFSVPGQG
ncbi:RsmG family class I SAM-dependent methyltransferase [Aliamphritea spongicola]|nr:RsmG family class I SAM-dependent methyltransferase [Aliamphritea spongicola]